MVIQFNQITLEKIKEFFQCCKKQLLKKMGKDPRTQVLLRQKKRRFDAAASKNPYLQSKAIWNDMYGDMHHRLQLSQRLNFILSGVIVIFCLGLVIISSQSKIKPYPFIIHGNEIISATESSSAAFSDVQAKLSPYFAKEFIRAARSVSSDGDVNEVHELTAFSFVKGEGALTLRQFFERNDPNTVAKHLVKTINITSVLPLSSKTMQVRWQEDNRNSSSGDLVDSKNYIAEMTVSFQAPATDDDVLKYNPLGFYITFFSWSEDSA